MNLLIGPLAPIIQQLDTDVLAAPVTVPDEDGPNDEPGQKDLTQLTIDYDSAPGVTLVSWNWDETGTSGANTLDACSLFDIDDNLFVDFALCAITVGDPAQSSPGSPRAYTCGDDRVDRCTNQVLVSDFDSTCTIGTGVNPFNGDDDATASCTILLSDLPVGSADPVLVNVCTYPSQIPHSDPSDCVLIPRTAFLTVIKEVINDNGGDAEVGDFPLFIDDMSVISGDRTPVTAAIHTVSETSQPGYDMTGISGDCAADGTITVEAGDDLTCTITNDDVGASLTVTKVLPNDSGGDATCDEFSFSVNGGANTAFEADCSNTFPVDAGTYTVTETVVAAGYTPSYSNCTDVVIALGGSATCTITNDDQAGSLTVTKVVSGGDATCDEFSFSVNGGANTAFEADCSNTFPVNAGTYTVTEPVVAAGYTPSFSNCTDVVIALGGSATCTITNTRDTGDLTVIKALAPSEDSGVFDLLIDGTVEADDVGDGGTTGAVTVETGTHTVGEAAGTNTTLGNYSSVIECRDDGGEGDVVADASGTGPLDVEVALDDDIVCVISNTRVTVGFDKANDLGDNAAVAPGETIHYELSVFVNDGTATNVIVTDELPDGLTYVDESATVDGSPAAGFTADGQDLTWEVASLTEGTHVFAYDATVDADATGPLTNLGCVDVDQNDALVCDEVTVRVPTLVVDKAASLDLITISGPANAPVATPSVVTWTLTYTLTDGPVTNAVISDEIPVGFVFLDAANGGTEADGVVTWTFAELNTSGSVTFRTTVDPATISLTAPTVNTAIIDSDQTPEDEGQDSVTVTREGEQGGNPTPAPPLPNTALGTGLNGEPITVPIELLVAFFIGSLGALALANVKSRNNRR